MWDIDLIFGELAGWKQGRQVREEAAQKGSITIEATISLVTFCFFLLFFLNFARVFRAQNVVAHGVIHAAKNMSIENYWLGGIDDTKLGGMVNAIIDIFADTDGMEDTYASWGAAGGVVEVAKDYFIASITGTGGTESEADSRLKTLGIEGGLSGLDFSGTALSEDKITVKVTYNVKLMFPLYSIGEIEMEQYSSANLWKYQDWKYNGIK